jgi:hypothetical protein
MRSSSVLLLVLLALATSATSAREAAGEGHEAAAIDMLDLIGIEAGVVPMMERMRDTTVAQLAALDVRPGEEEVAGPYLDRVGAIIERTLSWDNLRGDFVDAYTATFTEEELVALATFFRSPVGAKYLDNVSGLNRLAMEIVRENAMAAAPEIRDVTEAMQAALPPREDAASPHSP